MIRRLASHALLALGALVAPLQTAAADGLTYLVHEPELKTAHPPLIVLLHGSGADERDMIGLWKQLPGQFVVISPRGPFGGGGAYRWYGKGGSREADIAVSRKIVDLMVANAVARFDVDPNNIFVAGFSQGAVMTYEVALHEPGRFRGAAVLSGTLFPSAMTTRADWTHEAFFIAHGTADPRIPFASAAAARATLARLNVPLAFHAYPGMRHEISETETKDLAAWLRARAALGAE